MTEMSSEKAMSVRPIAPYLSKRESQYSPAPVVKMRPMQKQNAHATPEKRLKHTVGNMRRLVARRNERNFKESVNEKGLFLHLI